MLKELWLQLSGFGIMFAILSWLQEASILSKELGGIKGLIAVVTGLGLYYFIARNPVKQIYLKIVI